MTSPDLAPYCALVDFLGNALGQNYEIALHDLRQKENALIAIANGHLSGRKVGNPLTKATLKMLEEGLDKKSDFIYDYEGIIDNGTVLHSSSMFIKDASKNTIGMLCINSNTPLYDELFTQLKSTIEKMENFNPRKPKKGVMQEEVFATDMSSLMDSIYEEAAAKIPAPTERLTQNEKLQLISRLKDQGLFQLKGAVPYVAQKLSCSTASVYRYLGELDQ